MNILEQLELLERLHLMIKRRGTGNPRELANKLGVSKRQLYRYMNLLKAKGATIRYSNFTQTYYYEELPRHIRILA